MIYDGKVADDLAKDQLIEAIVNEFKVKVDENIQRAMEETFRCGFLRGEEYGKSCQLSAGLSDGRKE